MKKLQATALLVGLVALAICWHACLPARESLPPESAEQASPSASTRLRNGGNTYYVRPDGGSADQCTGLADAPYPGSGTDQPCAWDHPFRALPPDGTPRISGSDTLVIASGSYMMGYGAPGADLCSSDYPWGCYMPAIPSGPDPDHPTRILGAGCEEGCPDPPELWGTERPEMIVNLTDASNVEIACLEITDHSDCVESHAHGMGGSDLTCKRDTYPFGPWADVGIYGEDSAHVTLRHLNIHGLASTGVWAGRLTDWTVEDVRIAGNGWAGWDGDIDGDDSNAGTMLFRRWTVEWNGCAETYPGGEPTGCWAQTAGGYGDGVGTGATGGDWIIEDSRFLHNTSDGLDLLYHSLGGIVVLNRVRAEGNAGNQAKISGQAIITNSVLVGNCAFFEGKPFTYNVDNCRALGNALELTYTGGEHSSIVNTTIYGQGDGLVCGGPREGYSCDGSERLTVWNNIFLGDIDYTGDGSDITFHFYQEGCPSLVMESDYNIAHMTKNITCGANGTYVHSGGHDLCQDPQLSGPLSGNTYGMTPTSGSPAIDAGTATGAPTVDFRKRPRDAHPDIGAHEVSLTEAVIPDDICGEPGTLQYLTSVYRNPNGWQDIRYADLLVNTQETITKCIYARYDAEAGRMFLRQPRDRYWMKGKDGIIRNNYGALDTNRSSVVTDTDTLTVTWALTPTWRTSGKEHNLYLAVEDMNDNRDGWNDHGDWLINRTPNWLIAPTLTNRQVVTAGVRYTFDPKYRDKDGRRNLDELYFAIADAMPSGDAIPGGILLKYDVTDGAMYLYDDASGSWTGGHAPGTNVLLQDERVKVVVKWSRVWIADHRTWTVRWRLEFKDAFAGKHNLYMRAVDLFPECNGDTGWKYKGWIEVRPPSPTVAGCGLLPANNIWNVPVDTLPLDANSDAYIATIGATAYVHADFGSGEWPPGSGSPIGIPYVDVSGSQPKVAVTFNYADESDPGPYPIPSDAPIEGGSDSDGDRHVLVVDRDHCLLYELYDAWPQPDGSWHAGSGAIYDLGSYALRPETWTSADAAGLPILPGLVRYDEVAQGEIRHALRVTAPQTRRAYVWPARHYASSLTGAQYPPMGQRFRLRADYDISGFSPEVQVILRALKTYGMMLADNGAPWFISGVPDERWDNDVLHELHQVEGSAFEALDVSSLMVNSDSGQAQAP